MSEFSLATKKIDTNHKIQSKPQKIIIIILINNMFKWPFGRAVLKCIFLSTVF